MNLNAAALAYVRYVLQQTKMSAHSLATKAKISPSTLTRALNDPKHAFTLSMKTIEKIANASGVNPAPFLEAKDTAELNTAHLFHRKALDEEIWGQGANGPTTTFTHVVGTVAAGIWVEPSVAGFGQHGFLRVTSSLYPAKYCFACLVEGDSANMLAFNGEILLCVRTEAAERRIGRHSSVVIVERRSRDEYEVELSARFLAKRRGHRDQWQLLSLCKADQGNKPKYFETINLEDEILAKEYRVIGYVECVLREALNMEDYFKVR